MKFRYPSLLVSALFLFACQGDEGMPSDPGRGIDLTAGVCKSDTFTGYTEAMYTSSTKERTRLQQCKTAIAAYERGRLDQAEAAVDAILVGVFQDYQAGILQQRTEDATLEESTVGYMTEACALGGLTPGSECVLPDEESLEDGSWVAYGPLSAGGTGQLQDLFGFKVDGGRGVFVFVSSRPSESFLGDCPGSSSNDCQPDVFDVDVDGTSPVLIVESCEIFNAPRLRHLHCPEGGECEFGEFATAPGLITCTVEPEGFLGFVHDVTRPVQWVIRATPAFAAGVGSKFTQFSPIVLGDMDPRARGVLCKFESQYSNGSAGTICEIFEQGTTTPAECAPFDENGNGIPCSCTSEPNEGDATGSSCSMQPKVPDQITYDVKARKTGASDGSAFTAMGSVTLAPGAPPRGGSNSVCFQMDPPRAFWVSDCTGF